MYDSSPVLLLLYFVPPMVTELLASVPTEVRTSSSVAWVSAPLLSLVVSSPSAFKKAALPPMVILPAASTSNEALLPVVIS
ncbi:hypothetical protein D3C87_2033680 [compost metagenome]